MEVKKCVANRFISTLLLFNGISAIEASFSCKINISLNSEVCIYTRHVSYRQFEVDCTGKLLRFK